MKKLMFAAVAAAGLGLFADGIESANVVGYTSDTITAKKFNMVCVPFEGTDGDGFKLNQCLAGVNLIGSDDASTSDLIQIWDATLGGYENWFYYDVGDEWTGWWDELTALSLFEDVYPNGLPAGSAFWYKSNAAATQNGTATLSGQVLDTATATFEVLRGKFNMVADAYPVALKLNDSNQVAWTGATGSDDASTSDLIQIWDATLGGYENWFYYDVGDEWTGWWDELTALSLFEDVYPDGLAVGKPFWYKAYAGSGTFDITFKK